MGLPVMLTLKDREVLIVGGGTIAYRKAKAFMDDGAKLTCVSPSFIEEFLKQELIIKLVKRKYEERDLDNKILVVAATDSNDTNDKIYKSCYKQQILCMTVDHESSSDFSFMAIRKLNELTISVSTDGKSPVFSKSIVDKLINTISDEDLLELKESIKQRKQRLDK